MALTWLEVWPFTEGTGTTVDEILTGVPDLQGFGTNGTWNDANGQGWINQFLAAPNVTGNAIDSLNGATQATLVVAMITGATLPGNGEIVAEIGQDESPGTDVRFGIGFSGSGSTELRCRANNSTIVSNAEAIYTTDTWFVSTLVYDSPNATASDRARFWVNTTRVGTTETITQNATISFGTGTDEVKVGCPFGSTNGRIYWMGFALGAATDTEVATIYTNLTADNDITDPTSGGAPAGPTYNRRRVNIGRYRLHARVR